MEIIKELIDKNKDYKEVRDFALNNLKNLTEQELYILINLDLIQEDDFIGNEGILTEDIVLRLIEIKKIRNSKDGDLNILGKKILTENQKSNMSLYYQRRIINDKEIEDSDKHVNNQTIINFAFKNEQAMTLLLKENLISNENLKKYKPSEAFIYKMMNVLKGNKFVLMNVMNISVEQLNIVANMLLELALSNNKRKENLTCLLNLASNNKCNNQLVGTIEKIIGKINNENENENQKDFQFYIKGLKEDYSDFFGEKVAEENLEIEMYEMLKDFFINDESVDSIHKDKIKQLILNKKILLSSYAFNDVNVLADEVLDIKTITGLNFFINLISENPTTKCLLRTDMTKSFYYQMKDKIIDNSENNESLVRAIFFEGRIRDKDIDVVNLCKEVLPYVKKETLLSIVSKLKLRDVFSNELIKNIDNDIAINMGFNGLEDCYRKIIKIFENRFEKGNEKDNEKDLLLKFKIMFNNVSSFNIDSESIVNIREVFEKHSLTMSDDFKEFLNERDAIRFIVKEDQNSLKILLEKREQIAVGFDFFANQNKYIFDDSYEILEDIPQKIIAINQGSVSFRPLVFINKIFKNETAIEKYLSCSNGEKALITVLLGILENHKIMEYQEDVTKFSKMIVKKIGEKRFMEQLFSAIPTNASLINFTTIKQPEIASLDFLKKIIGKDYLNSEEMKNLILNSFKKSKFSIENQELVKEIILSGLETDECDVLVKKLSVVRGGYEKEPDNNFIKRLIEQSKKIVPDVIKKLENQWIYENQDGFQFMIENQLFNEFFKNDENVKKILNTDLYKKSGDGLITMLAKKMLLKNSQDNNFVELYLEDVSKNGVRTLNNMDIYNMLDIKDILNTERLMNIFNIISCTRLKDDVLDYPSWITVNEDVRSYLKETCGSFCINLMTDNLGEKEYLEDWLIVMHEQKEMRKAIGNTKLKKTRKF